MNKKLKHFPLNFDGGILYKEKEAGYVYPLNENFSYNFIESYREEYCRIKDLYPYLIRITLDDKDRKEIFYLIFSINPNSALRYVVKDFKKQNILSAEIIRKHTYIVPLNIHFEMRKFEKIRKEIEEKDKKEEIKKLEDQISYLKNGEYPPIEEK